MYDDRTGWSAHGLFTDLVCKRINPTAGSRLARAHTALNASIHNRLGADDDKLWCDTCGRQFAPEWQVYG